MKILLVGDSEKIRKLLKTGLTILGYAVDFVLLLGQGSFRNIGPLQPYRISTRACPVSKVNALAIHGGHVTYLSSVGAPGEE